MAGSILKLMQDATYGVSIQAPDSGLTADIGLRIIRATLTYSMMNGWGPAGTTEGKSYLVIGASYGTWATPITAISIELDGASMALLRHADYAWAAINGQVKQGGSWVNLNSGITDGDVVYLYAIES